MVGTAGQDEDFDKALIRAAFALVAEKGWQRLSIVEAAQAALLPLDRARRRFPNRVAVLARFGALADAAALADLPLSGTVRDRLFDLTMKRIDVLQEYRAGIVALLRRLPFDPPLALILAALNQRSMAWLVEAAGLRTTGPVGRLRVHGMEAVWLWTLRAWARDESADLAATLAALDAALTRAEQLAAWLPRAEETAPLPGAATHADANMADENMTAPEAHFGHPPG